MGAVGIVMLLGGLTGAFIGEGSVKSMCLWLALIGFCILIWLVAVAAGENVLGPGEINW